MKMKIGCVIMASGMARRFGSNKLLHDFLGEPVICRILRSTREAPLACRVVVTRHPEIEAICREKEIPVLLHALPLQSDTVALGVNYLLKQEPAVEGILFAASDQPCLRPESIVALCCAFEADPTKIYRLHFGDTLGNPVLFPRSTFEQLLHLPPDKGGGAVVKKHPELVCLVEASDETELVDVDTPEILKELLKKCSK